MIELFVRGLLVIAGSISSWFVTRDALNFSVVQMVVAVVLFTLLIIVIAFWSSFCGWVKRWWR